MNAARRVVERAVSNPPGSRGISRRESEIAIPRIADLMGNPFLTADTFRALAYAWRSPQETQDAQCVTRMPKEAEPKRDNPVPVVA
jgi:hypothetical protein